MVCATSALCVFACDAQAYNEPTHRRIVEVAVDAMRASSTQAGPIPRPDGVDPAQWDAFITRALRATNDLSRLRTGLTGAYDGFYDRDHNDSRARPKQIVGGGSPAVDIFLENANDPRVCDYRLKSSARPESPIPAGREYNLLNAGNARIFEFPYVVEDGYRPCAFKPWADGRSPGLGDVLGWHAASVDWRIADSSMWVRPTNTGMFGLLQEAQSRAFEYAGGALVFPFLCLYNLFTGRSCSMADAQNIASSVNVLELVQGLVPGVGPIDAAVNVGMWHFVDVEATQNRFNDTRGLFYENAGPNFPGAFDVAIMVATDIAGLTLHPFASEGVKRYGAYDRRSRNGFQWQAHNVGHTEFSPVSNLANHGWNTFAGIDAAALGWPLHAIGDSAAPHHVTGTTSWGHRSFEDAVEQLGEGLLPRPTSTEAFGAVRDRVLRSAFEHVRDLNANSISIPSFVINEARVTRDLARNDDDWIFKDSTSVEYLTPLLQQHSIDAYKDHPEKLRPFVEHAVANTIAFLIVASERMRPNEPAFEASTLCGENQYFTGRGSGCAEGIAPGLGQQSMPLGLRAVSCVAAGQSCLVTSDCCDGTTCNGSSSTGYGRCEAPPPPPPPPPPTCVHGSCTSNSNCIPGSGVCGADGCCQAPVCSHGTCSTDADCLVGEYCSGVCCLSLVQ
ncbi:MAG: hypothetical protein KIT84_23035 [Labilithrix sp.]|nr:hypothetical protein [Labilithrix sp.]MCW5813921.1 hypothetical protein [Labilithrix sp.]